MQKSIVSALWLLTAILVACAGSLGATMLFRAPLGAALEGADPHLRAAVTMPIPVVEFGLHDSGRVIALAIATVAVVSFCCWRAMPPLASVFGSRLFAMLISQFVAVASISLFAVTLSPDPYAYIIYGRLAGIHGISPYQIPGAGISVADASLRSALRLWGNPPIDDDYGPVWTTIAGALARLDSGASLGAQVLLERVVAAVALCAATVAFFPIFGLERAQDGLRRAGALALTPLVVFETALNGHNDILMVACAAWAFALVDVPVAAGLLLGLSIGIKYTSIVVAPFLIAHVVIKRGPRAGVCTAAFAAIVPLLALAPYWAGPQFFHGLAENAGRVEYSVPAIVTMAVSGVLDRIGLGHRHVQTLVSGAFKIAFATYACFQIREYIRTRAAGPLPIWRTLVALFVAMPTLSPYYFIWLLPMLAVRGSWGLYARTLFGSAFAYYIAVAYVSLNAAEKGAFAGELFAAFVMLAPIAFVIAARFLRRSRPVIATA